MQYNPLSAADATTATTDNKILIYGLLLILNYVVDGCSNNNNNSNKNTIIHTFLTTTTNDYPFHSTLLCHTHTLSSFAVTFAIRANALTMRCKFDRLIRLSRHVYRRSVALNGFWCMRSCDWLMLPLVKELPI